ncbi:hypothetical protein R5R35_002868 [Gryllus longicercus]|uniref:EGF-like domain-containing protein n=1 Tax=Gryllus longicercus TaxID=2509291 RepID=A0AAN9Z6M5_9ORTH
MAKLLMMSELSGDVLTHRSRRCFSVYSLSSLQHGDLKMNEAEVLAKKYSFDDHQNDDSDLGSNSGMESSRPVQHNRVRGFVLLAALAVLVAVVFAFPQREESTRIQCGYSTCGRNSYCGRVNGFDACVCNQGFYGSAYGEGCTSEPECTDNSGCSDDHFCDDQNLCVHACRQCPADVGCNASNHTGNCIYNGTLFFDPPREE